MKLRQAFTLVEIFIVVIVSAILFVLLAKAYINTSKLYIYQKNVKNIETDLLFFNQTLQNLADESEIDFDAYSGQDLKSTYGFTENLYLKTEKTKYRFFLQSWQIILEKKENNNVVKIPLTNTGTSIVDELKFKIIPYEDPYKVYTSKMQQPYVEVFLSIKTRFYNPKTWEQAVKYELQEWFNFKYYAK